MKFECLEVGRARANSYIIYDEESLEALIIDPGDTPKVILNMLQTKSLQPKGIILTHHHFDHIGAAKKLKKEYGCPIYIHKDDQPALEAQATQFWSFLVPRVKIRADKLVTDGEMISVGKVSLKVIHTPGHSAGSICIEALGEKVVFTGDTIFARGIGRTDFKGGNEIEMFKSLYEKVNHWSDDVTIYPGHGRKATMAEVRRYNSLFRMIIEQISLKII